ncbi:MAG: 4Fe-4S binding protein [Prevotella sp.]|nr:4Fe-4S binding protein [Prevotella sp.]
MKQKGFHRHLETPHQPLYWLLFGYILLGFFWPIVGWALLFYIIGTILTAFWRGRWWCGHICPRGNMFLHLLSKYSPHRPIPSFVRTVGFRLFVIVVIFASFGIGFYRAWGDWSAMGGVFWKTILITTIIGIILSFIYAPLTWCSFCPIGTLAAWASPKKKPLPKSFTGIHIDGSCDAKCKSCARVCPMQLTPYIARGESSGFLHPDCFKCGKCCQACPSKKVKLESVSGNPQINNH